MAVSIMIDSNFITIGSKLISIGLGLVTMFLLFEIKGRVIDKLKPTFIYLIIATIFMICVRALGIMNELGMWVSTFYDSAIVIFSLFMMLSILDFYKFTIGVTRQIERNISEPESVRREEPQTSIIYANKLKQVENKIREVEGRIKGGNVKVAEAGKMSRRFKMQLESLDEAYEKGYISKEAYVRGKERIKGLDLELRKKHL